MSVASNIAMHDFTDCPAQANALAGRIANCLRDALQQRDHAVLAVSGGTTPRAFFTQLAGEVLDWSQVQLTLVDERWVSEDDPRSNAALVRSTLLCGAAAAAKFVPLYTGAATPEQGLAEATRRVQGLPQPFDAVVLGMGEDGHTASFFPDGDRLAEALDLGTTARVLPMHAASADEPRITLTLAALLDTRALFLQITGAAKRVVLQQAENGTAAGLDHPIRAVLTQQRVPLDVYWCP